MDTILEMLTRGVEQLLGRAGGPLRVRLVMMPTVATVPAIRAGLRDAREGRPAFLWALLSRPDQGGRLVRSAAADVGRVFVVAIAMDTVYQLAVLRELHVVQLFLVAVACAIVPYALIRGPVTRLARGLRARAVGPSAAATARPEGPSRTSEAGASPARKDR